MNQKIIKRKELNREVVRDFSQKTGLNPHISEFLLSYDLKPEDVADFINPDISHLNDPFAMKGMKQAVERLRVAAEEEQTVVVYGDYDADGICASAILSLYLAKIGVNVFTHIPSRKEGYGLKNEVLEHIIEECNPDLILTCDCGISAYDEVEYALDLGVDVIVTDHHEVGAKLPQCIVVNVKQDDCNYPFKQLCGAGVALKLVQAMGGTDEAKNYFDIAAVATLADLVPLLGENRLIVQLGLKALNKGGNKGLKSLLETQKIVAPTATDISFKVVPRINAAGRMGDAYRAFNLLITSDEAKIDEIISEIEGDNTKRRNICDEIYSLAIEKIKAEKLLMNPALVLYSDEWDKGVVGIVAARLTEEFNRPCMIIVKSGEIYKGTARSVDGINIFEVLSSCAELLTEFGGHNQAAGFSIEKNKIEEFSEKIYSLIGNYDKQLFIPKYYCDLEMETSELDLNFVTQLEKLEPFGNGFSRPLIKSEVEKLQLSQTRSGYYTAAIENGQLISFNPLNINFLVGNEKKLLFLEPELNTYLKQQSVRGIIKNVLPINLYINDEVAEANKVFALKNIFYEKKNFKKFNLNDLKTLIGGEIYGTIVVASDRAEYEENLGVLETLPLREFFGFSTVNNISRVIVSPVNFNITDFGFKKIVFLSSPPDMKLFPNLSSFEGEIYAAEKLGNYSALNKLSVSREDFATCYEHFRRISGKQFVSPYACYKSLKDASVSYNQFVFCLIVFEELGLLEVNYSEFSVTSKKGIKVTLSNSAIYNFVS